MRGTLLALFTLQLCSTAAAADPQKCSFNAGTPAAQPVPVAGVPNFTCASTDDTAVGSGVVTLSPDREKDTYLDAQIFNYHQKVVVGSGKVKVAALVTGADGGCVRHNPPAGWPAPPATQAEAEKRIIDYLSQAGVLGADVAVLPENAFGRRGMKGHPGCTREPETVKGPAVTSVRAVAKRYSMNIILPLHEGRDGKVYNTAVVINRQGEVVGNYSKVFPVFGNVEQTIPPTIPAEVGPPTYVVPSSQGARVFDLDFGRVAVFICYDINFAELWLQAEALGADMVLWPSAMATPDPSINGYARIFQYDIVSVGFPGQFLDRAGVDIPPEGYNATDWPMLKMAHIDIDRTFVHWDNNHEKVEKLLGDHPEVVKDVEGPPFWLLRSTDPSTSVRALCKQYQIETSREYIHRSREGLNRLRNYGV